MANDKVYIWYSGATDLTGKNLMDALDVEGGTNKPSGRKVVIGWGTKIKKDIGSLGKDVKVLNHPDQIRANRNKFQALALMRYTGNTPVADFYTCRPA